MCKALFEWVFGKKVVATIKPEPEPESAELIALKKRQYKTIVEKAEEEAKKENEYFRKYAEEYNSKCPKCGAAGGSIVNAVQRVQGEAYGHVFGGMHGSIDTNEVNVCNSCGNQWKKASGLYTHSFDILETKVSYLYFALSAIARVRDTSFNPNDITSKYNSLEEAVADAEKQVNYWYEKVMEFWKDTSIEVIHAIIRKYPNCYYYIAPDKLEKYIEENYSARGLHDLLGLRYAKEFLKTE